MKVDSADAVISSGIQAVLQASSSTQAVALRERMEQVFSGPKAQQMILWIDPHSVCYRLGDRGTIRYIYQAAWAKNGTLPAKNEQVMPIY